MASLALFLTSMLLIVAGAVIMWAEYAPGQPFWVGLFVTMGGIILFAISLNYGPPPVTHHLGPLHKPSADAAPKAPTGPGATSPQD